MIFDYVAYLVLALLIVGFLVSAIRVLREYERGIVFTLGRFTGVKGTRPYYPHSLRAADGKS